MALINCKIVNSEGVEGSVSVVSQSGTTNIPDQALYIIPDQGYVVSASSFTHTNPLDTGIQSITFTDTATAGEGNNTVKVNIDLTNSYAITANGTLNIGVDGEAIDANLINVVPHIAHDATLSFAGMVTAVNIDKLTETNPPTINNIDREAYQAGTEYSANIIYLPCTIQPDVWTKVGTISVQTGKYPASATRTGWWHMKETPYLQNLTPTGNGLPLYELIQTGTQTDATSGATKQIDFDIMFKESNGHNLIGGEWPLVEGNTTGNYYHIASRDDGIGVKLVVPRPALMNDIISDQVIEVVNIGDFSASVNDIEANEFIDTGVTKTLETGTSPLDVSYLNPGNLYTPNAVGNINKVTTEEPNPISIQGTPGASFELGLQKIVSGGSNVDMGLGGTNDAVAGKWSTASTDQHGTTTYSAKTFTIPTSGTWVGAITDIAQIPANSTAQEYHLTVAAKSDATISTSAATPQSHGTITAAKNNTAVYKYTQPCSDVKLEVKLVANGDMGSYSSPLAGEYGVDGSAHYILKINGFGGSNYDSKYKTRSGYVRNFTATRTGTLQNGTVQTAILTGQIEVVKYPTENVTLTFDWNTFVDASKRDTAWTSQGTLSDFFTANQAGNDTGSGGSEIGSSVWTHTGINGAELTITKVALSINPSQSNP